MIEATCHCGAARLKIAHPPADVTDCNCSICRRLGVLWAYYSPSQVTLAGLPEATVGYVRANEGHIAFHHCRVCGCPTHWRDLDLARDRMGVNARLMAPEVLAAAKVRKLDGADTWAYLDE